MPVVSHPTGEPRHRSPLPPSTVASPSPPNPRRATHALPVSIMGRLGEWNWQDLGKTGVIVCFAYLAQSIQLRTQIFDIAAQVINAFPWVIDAASLPATH